MLVLHDLLLLLLLLMFVRTQWFAVGWSVIIVIVECGTIGVTSRPIERIEGIDVWVSSGCWVYLQLGMPPNVAGLFVGTESRHV